MRARPFSAAVVLIVFAATLRAQAPIESAVTRLDPALDAILSAGAKVEVLRDDLGSTEGPVWIQERPSGYLLFSDQVGNVIHKWSPGDRMLSTFLEHSGFTGTDPSKLGRLIGSNGMTLDRQGRLIVCAQGDRMLVRLEKDGKRTTLADRFEGRLLNGPNDVVMKSDGSFYFTDRGSGLKNASDRELPYRGVFRLNDGKLQLIMKDDPQGVIPNGIAFSRDEKHLYLTNETEIKIYDVQSDGMATNGRVFIDMSEAKGPGTADGMKVDRKGNIYATVPGGIWIISAVGKHIGSISTPTRPTNVEFGDADGKGLYITSGKNLWRLQMNASAR